MSREGKGIKRVFDGRASQRDQLALMLSPLYKRLLRALSAWVWTASSKWCFCARRRPSFELRTESGELEVIWRATSSAAGKTFDRSTTVFTL